MNYFKMLKRIIPIYLIIFFLLSCSSSQRFVEKDTANREEKPSQTSVPASNQKALLTLEGIASYYAHDFHGKKTSSGEIYDMNLLTAAHRVFPFGTKVKVTNLENDKFVIVKINDRGPFKEGRLIDLSLGAAKKIDMVLQGTARVRLEVIEWGTGQ